MQYPTRGRRFLEAMVYKGRVDKSGINYLLFLLVFVIVSGFITYLIQGFVFEQRILNLDTMLRNNDVEQQINTYIIKDIKSIENYFSRQLSAHSRKIHENNFY